jgi:hypothetical protein
VHVVVPNPMSAPYAIAMTFLEAFHDRLPSAMEDRKTKLLLSPTIFCSLGALVTSLVQEEDPEKYRLGNLDRDIVRPSAPYRMIVGRAMLIGVMRLGRPSSVPCC